MSEVNESPSSFSWEIYVCSKTLILALGSSRLSFTGIGTRSKSFASSIFIFSDCHIFKFFAEREQPTKLYVPHCWLQMLVICGYCPMSYVVIAGNTTQVRNLEIPTFPTILDQIISVQDIGSRMNLKNIK